MNLSKKGKKYAIMAGLCFLILFINQLFYIKNVGIEKYGFTGLLLALNYLGLTIMLFIVNKKIGLFVSAAYVLSQLTHLSKNLSLLGFLSLTVAIGLFLIILLAYTENILIKNTWFIPALLMAVYFIVLMSKFDMFAALYLYRRVLIARMIEIAGFLLIGLWLSKDSEAYAKEAYNISSQYDHANSYGHNNQTVIGSADKIAIYKELLDLGAISEEEFEMKKKEALNL